MPGDVRYFEGWFDTGLGVGCTWTLVDDTYRCLPDRTGFVYRDAGCTEPAVLVTECESYEYASPPPSSTDCAGGNDTDDKRVFSVGAVVDGAATKYWTRWGETCEEVVPATPAILAAVGSELAPETFVGGERRRDYSGTRLAVDFIRGEDGSQEQFVTYDLELETPCTPDFVRANGLCLPPSNVYLIQGDPGYFGGPDCAGQRLAFASACEPGGFVYEYVEDGECGYTSRYYELGEPWSGDVYTAETGTCTVVTQSVYTFYEVGAEISGSNFATLDTKTYGEGRLRMTVPSYEGEIDVTVPRNSLLYDTMLDVECSVTTTIDDGFRCLPSKGVVSVGDPADSTLWADPSCSESPLFVAGDETGCSVDYDWFHVSEIDACGVGGLSQLWSRGAQWTGDVYYGTVESCELSTLGEGTVAYLMEGPIPLSQFAELERVVE